MTQITYVKGREVLDSRGLPTVEVEIALASGYRGRMMVPSGASTGRFEAHELRDNDTNRYQGRGVLKAVAHVNGEIAATITGMNAEDQEALDQALIDLDGTPTKGRLGANAILGVSFAALHAYAAASNKPLFRYLADRYLPKGEQPCLPMPMVNIISGGLHAGNNLDIQDYLVIPVGAKTFPQALEMVSAAYWSARRILQDRGHIASLVADEGGFGPLLTANEAPLEVLCSAIRATGMQPGKDIAIALDIAASHFFDASTGHYDLRLDGRRLTTEKMITYLEDWVTRFPIISIEDGLDEEDWSGWQQLTRRIGTRTQLVGDDLFTTHTQRIQRGIEQKAGNAVLIKMNQIGTVTETVEAIQLAKRAGFKTVISARSGETEDVTLSDLAVGLNGGQIKIGSLSRSSRLAKYNQLLRINESLQGDFRDQHGIRI